MRISDWSSDVCSSDLSSLHDHRTGIAMTAFSFVTRHVFAWCAFYLVVLLMWTSFGLPEFPVVLLWMITLAFVIPDVISHIHSVGMIVGQKPTAAPLRNRQRPTGRASGRERGVQDG